MLKILAAKQNDKTGFLILGVENQIKVHYAMPVRALLYDMLQYSSQIDECRKKHRKNAKNLSKDEFLSGFTKNDKLIPVITLVVYFGTTPWDGALNLKDMFGGLDKDIGKFIPSYNLNLISPHLPDKDLEKLKSELGAVMQFIKNSNDKKKLMEKFEKNKQFHKLSHISAMVISEMTGLKMNINQKKEKIDMCKAIDDLIKDAKKEAEKETKKAEAKLEIANEKVKTANKVIKVEKEKNKEAKLRIKELEAEVLRLQAQLKTA